MKTAMEKASRASKTTVLAAAIASAALLGRLCRSGDRMGRISNDPLGRRYLWDNEPVGNIDPLAPDEPYFALDNDRR